MLDIFKVHPSRDKTQAHEWKGLCFNELLELLGTKSRPKIPSEGKKKNQGLRCKPDPLIYH